MILDVIAGARPNFIKVAALFAVAAEFPTLQIRLIHTGQHYDINMSDVFFQQLHLPAPTHHLGVGSGSHATQTGTIMQGYERWITQARPDMCVVVGDVNSTIACALAAAKLNIPVAHVEAGLRSFDRMMPEEVNRVLTDCISDLMFATESSAVANLAREGRPPSGIHLVGQVMIDTLLRMLPHIEQEYSVQRLFGVNPGEYAYVTLHRPTNVDDPLVLDQICDQLIWLAQQKPVIFAIHPRTRARLEATDSHRHLAAAPNLHLIEPVGYLESIALARDARLVITDSGGLQEETTALGVSCLTLRKNTERPVTITEGTNTLIGHNWALFRAQVNRIYSASYQRLVTAIPYWDGQAGRRILKTIASYGDADSL
jgi:UDP-N-acetylglucosamine 2-epimerase (non-hydrolysing)